VLPSETLTVNLASGLSHASDFHLLPLTIFSESPFCQIIHKQHELILSSALQKNLSTTLSIKEHLSQTHRLPVRYWVQLLKRPLPATDQSTPYTGFCRVFLYVFDSFHAGFTIFSIAREYCHHSSQDPNSFPCVEELSNFSERPSSLEPSIVESNVTYQPPWPWPNTYVYLTSLSWKLTGSGNKSNSEVDWLFHNVLLTEDFTLENLKCFNAYMHTKHLDTAEDNLVMDVIFKDGCWKKKTIAISFLT